MADRELAVVVDAAAVRSGCRTWSVAGREIAIVVDAAAVISQVAGNGGVADRQIAVVADPPPSLPNCRRSLCGWR